MTSNQTDVYFKYVHIFSILYKNTKLKFIRVLLSKWCIHGYNKITDLRKGENRRKVKRDGESSERIKIKRKFRGHRNAGT